MAKKSKATAAQKKSSKGFKNRTAGQKLDVKQALRGFQKDLTATSGIKNG